MTSSPTDPESTGPRSNQGPPAGSAREGSRFAREGSRPAGEDTQITGKDIQITGKDTRPAGEDTRLAGMEDRELIQRHFLGWDEAALPLVADLLVAAAFVEDGVAANLPETESRGRDGLGAGPEPGDGGLAGSGGQAAAQGGGAQVLDLSHLLVALPGGRAGRRLQELLLDRAEARSMPLRPPRVVTAGALPEILFPPARPEPSPFLLRRLWAQALAGLPPGDREVLVPDPPDGSDLAGWMGLARQVLELQATVGAEGHDFHRVAEGCAEGLLFNDEARWILLSRAQERVRGELQALGLRDREAHRQAILAGEVSSSDFDGQLWLVGVAEMPGVVRQVVGRALAPGREGGPHQAHVVVHAPPEMAQGFDALGCVVPTFWAHEELSIPDGVLRVEADPRDQARAVVRELARIREAEGAPLVPEEVTLGVPDPEVVPFLGERLREAGVTGRLAAGTPLDRTLPARLLSTAAEYLRGHRWEGVAGLLRHPALATDLAGVLKKGGGEGKHRESPPALADAYHGVHFPLMVRRPPGFRGGRGGTWLPSGGERRGENLAEGLSTVLDHLLDQLLGELTGPPRPLSQWDGPVRQYLLAGYGDRELDSYDPADREVMEVARVVSEFTEALTRLPEALDTPVDGATALTLLVQELAEAVLPPLADEEAVELLGWLEVHLDDAPILIVTGVNAPYLPQTITGDPFLPHSLRSRLGLLDNDRRWARDLYQLKATLASRPHPVLMAGRRTLSGDPLRPSRLLLTGEGQDLARRLTHFLAEETAGGGRVGGEEPGSGSWDEEEGVPPPDPFQLPPEPFLEASRVPDRLAVTRFRAIMSDPYRFALEAVLDLGASDDAGRELDPMAFGTLAHQVLEDFGRGVLAQEEAPGVSPVDPTTIRSTLDRILDREVRSRFGQTLPPAVRIQVEQLRRRLSAFADWQAAWTAEGWRMAGVEVRPSDPGHPFPVDDQAFYLTGRIDRVDHHPDTGRWALLDYKTSRKARTPEKTHRKRSGRAKDAPMEWVDLQLPLYRHLIRSVKEPDGSGQALIPEEEMDGLHLGFINLPADLEATGAELALGWTTAELAQADERAREVVRFLRDNRFQWDPEESRIRIDDSLASLVGVGVYRELDEEDEDEGDGYDENGYDDDGYEEGSHA